ncbi:MAG: Crp/Fnr family transcriptional regulator [Timaviella obliquedivisa GSE-PSE-MK23-08B]|jgi:CRP-like cAMP-binding protein|nr:Crp/Fnr family transcriptional regulator [Timaviella obliquedivisa GSE-PSE-MK23-08B]
MTRYWLELLDWAQEHYRYRTFRKDEKIPARTGLLYLVHQGFVRLVGEAQVSSSGSAPRRSRLNSEEAFLGFIGSTQPFEVIAQYPFNIQSFAHVDNTAVIWLYWEDLENRSEIREEVMAAFRYQHQRKLLWLSTLGQRRTSDRLLGFLTLLIEESGQPCEGGYYLPFTLTHAQIGSAIGSTRVTVTRLIGKLRRQGLVRTYGENLISLPSQLLQQAQS